MTQILTVTLNPALDIAASAPRVVPGIKLRCTSETREPGGGGVNVARAISQLGGHARAVVALAGPNGMALETLLKGRNLDLIRVEAPSETRHSFAVTDEQSGEQYRFVMAGPDWTEAHLTTVLQTIQTEAPDDALVVFSGSMPPGAPVGFLPRACEALGTRRVIIDTSGAHLTHQASGPAPTPHVLRMDSHEAMTLSGKPLSTRDESVAYAEVLRRKGAGRIVIIARGKDGSVMACPNGHWHVNAANQRVVSAIGAGDSFVGGFTLALSRGDDPQEALRHGAAAASAACLSEGTQLCLPEDFETLLPQTKLTRI